MVPEVHRVAYKKDAFPEVGAGNRTGFWEDRPMVPERSHHGIAGGERGILGGAI